MELVHVVLKEVGDFTVRKDRFLVSSLQQYAASTKAEECQMYVMARLAWWA
jgi:hypothetical protein